MVGAQGRFRERGSTCIMFDSLTRLPAQQLAGDIVLALLMCWFIICVLMTAATHITTGRKSSRQHTGKISIGGSGCGDNRFGAGRLGALSPKWEGWLPVSLELV